MRMMRVVLSARGRQVSGLRPEAMCRPSSSPSPSQRNSKRIHDEFFTAKVELKLTKNVFVQVSADTEADAIEQAKGQAQL